MSRIAIVGMSCLYPDARDVRELWENSVSGRRAFRRIPDGRTNLADYHHLDPATPDTFYASHAAVIEGYEFDRVGHRISGATYRSTDLTHWLALDVAGRALADAGFDAGAGLPRETTSVIVGNSLTGEFTRASTMRLRWPYVRRTVGALLGEQGWSGHDTAVFLSQLESRYKAPFAEIGEDSLAGGLSNTIAGRICNYFDLKGGGYTVDGACSSSLLAVATASTGLEQGDADVAVAGGVDLSLDPFELVGFAKTGALSTSEMRLYDRRSNGFWPGEGCGMVVLMREEDALAQQRPIYATVTGWGISSDGQGGMTRPEQEGYELAVSRAYARAGYGVDTVAMFEGHGTGTPVGDALELRSLSHSRAVADPAAPPAAVGSIKALIGHTKAAAGVAGLIRATKALHEQVLPPSVGCTDPHPELSSADSRLRTLRRAEAWPTDQALRAGVSSMGFGGINTHVALESAAARRRPSARMRTLAASIQEHDLLLFDAPAAKHLTERIRKVADYAVHLSFAELSDLAAHLERQLKGHRMRAAVVAHSPADLQQKLRTLLDRLADGVESYHSPDGAVRFDVARLGASATLLFPGQGGGRVTLDSALRRRDTDIDRLYKELGADSHDDFTSTEVAQPHIVVGHLAGLRALASVGLHANRALGHSLGELAALHWAGAFDRETLMQAVHARGAAMSTGPEGAMVVVRSDTETVNALLTEDVVISGYNAKDLQVVAGAPDAVAAFGARAEAAGVDCTRLNVRRGFHSPLVAEAAGRFREVLDTLDVAEPELTVISTCTGAPIGPGTDVRELLTEQITSPVRFTQAVAAAAPDTDLFVEVGPGQVCTGLVSETGLPRVALDTDDDSLRSLLQVIGAAFVVGVDVDLSALFCDRVVKPIDLGRELVFFTNPCESAPAASGTTSTVAPAADTAATPEDAGSPRSEATTDTTTEATDAGDPLEVVRQIVADYAELPVELVRDDTQLLDELHLSSITIGQLAADAARTFGVDLSQGTTNFATATVAGLAEALTQASAPIDPTQQRAAARGAAPWARPFAIVRTPRPSRVPILIPSGSHSSWTLIDPDNTPGAEQLRRRLEGAVAGDGILIVSTAACDTPLGPEVLVDLQSHLADSAVPAPEGQRLVLVQHGPGVAGLIKSLWQEDPTRNATVIHVDDPASLTDERLADVVAGEVAATDGFHEVAIAPDLTLSVPELAAVNSDGGHQSTLEPGDLLLVTGGGKGITAECALALARTSGARLGLLGRSDPDADPELRDNLDRIADAGVLVEYRAVDVTDPAAVGAAVTELVEIGGPVRGVLHGAGRNVPGSFESLSAEEWSATFAPKVSGLRVVLDHVGDELRLLVAFGSIIGRVGLAGEAHYAVANEWLTALAEDYAATHPDCRVRCLEWSVWSGVGMGEKLSVVEQLGRAGVTAITPDQGVAVLEELVHDPGAPVVSVISGRTEGIRTMGHQTRELPLLRFLERPLIHYPDAELIVEATLSADGDPYLRDHLLDGNLLFPAVLGLEAMNEVAQGLTGHARPAEFRDVSFDAPIVLRPGNSTTIRIAATRLDRETLALAISTEDTGYQQDHFTARLHYTDAQPDMRLATPEDASALLPLSPANDLYGPVLFQGRAFQRIQGYTQVLARGATALLTPEQRTWFAKYHPQTLTLADPGVRDALMHGNQVSVPHATLLPVGIDVIVPAAPDLPEKVWMRAVETRRDGSLYTYDIDLLDSDGACLERWRGLRLRAVVPRDHATVTNPVLVGPLVSRVAEDSIEANLELLVLPDEALDVTEGESALETRRDRTARVTGWLLGEPAKINYRPDGKPELVGESAARMSASHSGGFTAVALSDLGISCDLQILTDCQDWDALLGDRATVAEQIRVQGDSDVQESAALVWAAGECLVKAGLPTDAPLTVRKVGKDGWVVFSSGSTRVLARITHLSGATAPMALAVAATATDRSTQGTEQSDIPHTER